MTGSTPLRLKASGIFKSYGAVNALSDVHFELRAGEVMALLGENGAGKSTIVKVISGLVAPDKGSIEIDGTAANISSVPLSQAAGIAVVQQEFSTVGTMTVAQNLVLGQLSAPWWWSPRKLNANAKEILERVGLAGLNPSTPVEELSVAEMQLLEIARVLARDAKVIIFDEPTAALSDAEIVRVLDAVKRLASEGRSVVYVTHRLGEVFEIADRVTVFRNGMSEAPLEVKVLDVETIVAKMIGRELGHLYPGKAAAVGEVVMEARGLRIPELRSEINLTLRRGEILGLTGQLGSGTSELMEAIAGVGEIVSGEVIVDGQTLNTRGRQNGISAGVAYCSADRKKDGIFARVPIRRNLSSPWLHRLSAGGFVSARAEVDETNRYAAHFAIDLQRMNSNVGTLSGGNQQKVALGKWLGINPRVLLVEEPTRGVDIGARADIYAQLRRLSDSGVGVIVSSSDTNEVLGLSDTIATFYRGEQTSIRPAEEWTESALVREVMHREEVNHD